MKRGLGKGLDALFSIFDEDEENELKKNKVENSKTQEERKVSEQKTTWCNTAYFS